jgi:hypothetical protein
MFLKQQIQRANYFAGFEKYMVQLSSCILEQWTTQATKI